MSPADEDALLDIAREAAGAAAAELLGRFRRRPADVQSKSSPTDLVSEADVAAERAIRSVLARRRPDDSILGEEGGATGDGELRWVVDPLDGTVNFLFGVPVFAISVACEAAGGGASEAAGETLVGGACEAAGETLVGVACEGAGETLVGGACEAAGETLVGVVLDPIRDECFAATRSGGASLNGVDIRGSAREQLATALVATGFGYDAGVRSRQAVVVSRVLPLVRDIRRGGAAAIDLAWCACGRYDAYYERGVHRWDVAAGSLIARRAGLEVRELRSTGEDAAGVLTAPPALIDELARLVA